MEEDQDLVMQVQMEDQVVEVLVEILLQLQTLKQVDQEIHLLLVHHKEMMVEQGIQDHKHQQVEKAVAVVEQAL